MFKALAVVVPSGLKCMLSTAYVQIDSTVLQFHICYIIYEEVRILFYSSEPNTIALPDDCVTHIKLEVAI